MIIQYLIHSANMIIHFSSRRPSERAVNGLIKMALVLILTPATLAAAIHRRDSLRVMICGDSISQGREGDYTWRCRIWQWFTDNKIALKFVGPYTGTHPQDASAFPPPPPLYGTITLPTIQSTRVPPIPPTLTLCSPRTMPILPTGSAVGA